jgi:hypothetical protein
MNETFFSELHNLGSELKKLKKLKKRSLCTFMMDLKRVGGIGL